MSLFKITADTKELSALADKLRRAKAQIPAAEAAAVNRVAAQMQPTIVRVLTRQTGLPKRTIAKAVKLTRATPAHPVATLGTRGGNVSLKYFHPVEGGGGVTATVKGRRLTVAGAFINAGRHGHRVPVKKLGGHVYVNTEGKKWGGHIRKLRSGLFIPAELVSGETRATFDRLAEAGLAAEAEKALAKIMPGT